MRQQISMTLLGYNHILLHVPKLICPRFVGVIACAETLTPNYSPALNSIERFTFILYSSYQTFQVYITYRNAEITHNGSKVFGNAK